jgi:hypothetical protein
MGGSERGGSGQGTGAQGAGQGTGAQGAGQGTGPRPQSGRGPNGRFPADRAPREAERGSGASRRSPDADGFGGTEDWGGRGVSGSRGAGDGRGTGGGRIPAGQAAALGGLRAGPAIRWMGTWPARVAIYIMLAATLLGVLGTLLTGNEPGFLLGFLVLIGSVVAALGVRRSAIYVIFPLPALANFMGAVMAGAIHDRGIDTSTTELGASFLQWIANVFFAMGATTIIVLVIAGARWLLARQLVSGQFAMSADRRPSGGGPRTAPASGRRPDRDQRPGNRDPWAAVDPWDGRTGTGGQGVARDQRDRRDPWGDRRPPGPGQPGTGPQPGGTNPPVGRPQPGGTTPPPGGRTPPASSIPPGGRNQSGGSNRGLPPDRTPRGPRDPWDDQDPRATRGRRPTRDQRDSRDPWSQR